ncbi:PLP-dependent cysteine synthase family protein [Actinobacillus capsulatus]|uniref:PLP-dependent cysteine synthase family protein n=1 Tax=Actinobacillus capsulatus TaxID=717 RepID=UPI00037F2CB5|nr:cysteine synthase family protein [Actinobacillus capsulatus]
MYNLEEYMGNTPLVKIKNIFGDKYANVYVKLEEFNPAGSIKSRVAYQMIIDAENKGKLKPGMALLEATGGNTGMGLAFISSMRGYDLTLVIPDNFSQEKINVLKQYGAKIILSDHKTGVGSHIRLANKLLEEDKSFYHLDQFHNFSNPRAHYLGTGKEIISQLNGNIHCFVAGIGSGGTIGGISKRLKEFNSQIAIYGVQPDGCDYLNNKTISHKIEAISVGIESVFFNKSILNGMISVRYDEVLELISILAMNQGIFVGLSSGANILASLKLSRQFPKSYNIVTVAPDSGKSYLPHLR